jgi:uncharacterized sulfatase
MPEKAAALRRQLHAWRERVGAQMPAPNPGYDPAKANSGPGKKAKVEKQEKR